MSQYLENNMTENSSNITQVELGKKTAIGTGVRQSAFFGDSGMDNEIDRITLDMQRIYKADDMPWVVTYSGGKDSTAVLQLVWTAIAGLEKSELHKPVYVITNDTLVENPIVSSWVKQSLDTMRQAAEKDELPIYPNLITPEVSKTFWVNLIGRGYPAPNTRFRWCTERMKISPTTTFIRKLTEAGDIKHASVIILLGTRKAESAARSKRITDTQKRATRELMVPHHEIASALTWAPIAEWTNDDVWTYLTSKENPWGHKNTELLALYASATEDAECPVVIDTSTPSCGNSRFGCWTCTLVEKDKSMSAMIHNDDQKEWMFPLLEIRDELAASGQGDKRQEMRDFRRMTGTVSLHDGKEVRGPYTQKSRSYWLEKVLTAQTWIRENGPEEVSDLELITHEELLEIRRIWVLEKHEREDMLPVIYQKSTGERFLDTGTVDDSFPFNSNDLKELESIADHDLQYELLRELISVEHAASVQSNRMGIWDQLNKAFDRSGFASEQEAIDAKKASVRSRDAASKGNQLTYEEARDEVTAGIPGSERT